MKEFEIMTAKYSAEHLQMDAHGIYRLARSGPNSVIKISDQLRFKKRSN